jgi:hypothetical protein
MRINFSFKDNKVKMEIRNFIYYSGAIGLFATPLNNVWEKGTKKSKRLIYAEFDKQFDLFIKSFEKSLSNNKANW